MKEIENKIIEIITLMFLGILLICFNIIELQIIGYLTNLTMLLSLSVFLLTYAMVKLYQRIRELKKQITELVKK